MSKRNQKELTRYMNAPLTDDERARAGLDMPDMAEPDKIREIVDRLAIHTGWHFGDLGEVERILREELEGLMVAAESTLAEWENWGHMVRHEHEKLKKQLAEYGWPWRKS